MHEEGIPNCLHSGGAAEEHKSKKSNHWTENIL
jgi:hypothetical protein